MKRSSLLQNTTLITFLKWANHGIFIIYFRSFQTKIITFFATNMCEKMSIQYMVPGFNPRSLNMYLLP